MRIFSFLEVLSSVAGEHSSTGDGECEKSRGLVASTTARSHAWNPRPSVPKHTLPALDLVCSRDALLPFNACPEQTVLPKLLHQPVRG